MFESVLAKMLLPIREWERVPVEPKMLRLEVSKMLERQGRSGYAGASPGMFNRSLVKLMKEGAQKLSQRDDMLLASGFSSRTELLGDQSLIDRPSLSHALISRWAGRVSDPLLGSSLWRTVFVAYFVIEGEGDREPYRKFLLDTLPDLRALKASPSWVALVDRHIDVLGDDAVHRYVQEWIEGTTEGLSDLQGDVDVPSSSWFWSAFVTRALALLTELDDDAFVASLPRYIELPKRFSWRTDDILAAMVERCAGLSQISADSEILELVIENWGSPQLELSDRSHRWNQVSRRARDWACQLLAERDLREFFELIKSSGKVLSTMDERRFDYWIRFTGRMQVTKLFLNPLLRESANPDIVRFLRRRRDRLGWLKGSTSNNLAFLMKMGDHWFVEFAATGNACYGYADNKRPFNVDHREISASSFRDPQAARFRMTHGGPWESEFDRRLASIGVWPNGVLGGGRQPTNPAPAPVPATDSLSATGLEPASASQPQPPARSYFTNRALIVPGLPVLEVRELSYLFTAVVDNRHKGGSYWIETSGRPSRSLIDAMNAAGFRFAASRGFYR